MYKVDNLSFTYRKTDPKIFENLCIDINENKIHLILGGSGSGKSTLINILSGIIPHCIEGVLDGAFWYGGEDLLQIPIAERAKKVGIVFQDCDTQFCMLTVEDEIMFVLENLCYPPEEMTATLNATLKTLGIEHLRERELQSLSGGEKQIVAVASVLVLNPALLIFDEPTANLDPARTREVFALMDKLKKEGSSGFMVNG